MRRARVKVWMMMIAVVVICIPLGGVAEMRSRRQRFRRIADYHMRKAPIIEGFEPPPSYPHRDWHISMSEKYRYASEHPWLISASTVRHRRTTHIIAPAIPRRIRRSSGNCTKPLDQGMVEPKPRIQFRGGDYL